MGCCPMGGGGDWQLAEEEERKYVKRKINQWKIRRYLTYLRILMSAQTHEESKNILPDGKGANKNRYPFSSLPHAYVYFFGLLFSLFCFKQI